MARRTGSSDSLLTKLRTLALLTAIFGAVILMAGCLLEVDEYGEPANLLADLEVSWTVGGVDRAAICSTYGVQSWVVELRGPESRDIVLDCRNNYWSTENDLLLLAEGTYSVRVIALDPDGDELARLETAIDLFDRGFIETLRLDFSPRQF